jgi:hypothetical protein
MLFIPYIFLAVDSVGVQEIRQGALQQLELLIHGLAPGDLTSPSRRLIRQDLVTTSTTPWIRQDHSVLF